VTSPYDLVQQAGDCVFAYLEEKKLSYDDAPELFKALYFLNETRDSFDGARAMAEKVELEASLH